MHAGFPSDEREQAAEVTRISAAYRERDSTGSSTNVYRFENAAYAFYLQAVEWHLLETFRYSPVELAGARVLDIGCGSGYFVNRLAEFGARDATGVDLMPARIEAARTRYPGLRFVCANAAQMPFDDTEFDVVTQFTCFSSVLHPDLRSAIAAEMWRVLRPGGIIVSFDMRPPPRALRAKRALDRWRRGRVTAGESATPTTRISSDELKRLFDCGVLQYSSAGLAFELCSFASRSYLAASMLAAMPGLREHGIGVVRKPCAR